LQGKKAESVNQRGREYVALRVMTNLALRFERGAGPATILELATELDVPARLVSVVLQPLVNARLVTEAGGADRIAYAPGRPPDKITCEDVLQTLRVGGGQELETRPEPCRTIVRAEFQKIQEAERQAAAVTLKEYGGWPPDATNGTEVAPSIVALVGLILSGGPELPPDPPPDPPQALINAMHPKMMNARCRRP